VSGEDKEASTRVRVRDLFLALQAELLARLEGSRQVLTHPTTKGDAAELNWLEMLKHLPERYKAAKAFVLDADGQLSEQVDVVIYDRQYSPLLFNRDGARYVPAESVYAVFEVRQDLDRSVVEYAGQKAASVRRLRRTSVPIMTAGGVLQPKEPFRILAGVLCLGSRWSPPLGDPLVDALTALSEEAKLDLGCVLNAGSFEAMYGDGRPTLDRSEPETALVFFFLRLLQRLQEAGTVTALDLREYSKEL
jgi:hypothetical protein